MDEIFKPFPLNSAVKVGNLGTIIRFNGRKNSLKPNNIGYLSISLQIDGVLKHFKQHQVVALTWVPNPNNLPEINHLNGIKTDNRADNLEWCTHKHNIQHSYSVLGRVPAASMLGKTHSEETKAKMRAAKQGKHRLGKSGKWTTSKPKRTKPTTAAQLWLKKHRQLVKSGDLPH